MKKFFTLIVAIVAMANMQAETLIVCDGDHSSSDWPIWMSGDYEFVDNDGALWVYTQEGSITQMIYPADMLTDMVNGDISQIKFHSRYAIRSYGGNVELSLLIVDFINFTDENRCYQYGAVPVANGTLVEGAFEVVFDLDQPYRYTGGNLLVQAKVTERITDISGDRYLGDYLPPINSSIKIHENVLENHDAYWIEEASWFLPKATFTYEAATTVTVGAPVFQGYTIDGVTGYGVAITPTTEGSEIMYRILVWDAVTEEWVLRSDWTLYEGNEGEIWFENNGEKVRIEAYAFIGQDLSQDVAYEFTVATALDELMSGKTVAGVRYFNMAGQEMQQTEGLTIVVTTYTDGTTNAVKVVK